MVSAISEARLELPGMKLLLTSSDNAITNLHLNSERVSDGQVTSAATEKLEAWVLQVGINEFMPCYCFLAIGIWTSQLTPSRFLHL